MKVVNSLILIICCYFLLSNHLFASQLPDFISLVKQHSAAVVNISTTQRLHAVSNTKQKSILPGIEESSPLNNLLRYLLNPEKPEPRTKKAFKSQSLGSGFLISSDGYVLTNVHVIKDATQIIVTLSDHREIPANLIGEDKITDVALLKIDETDLPFVKTGNSDALDIGQWVLAIGSPFGLDHTASQGIISGLGRNLPHDTYVPFIQTDVAINPGNSGGPLFNVNGEVIGINSQIFTKTGGSIGLSFAIPINVAIDVAKQIRSQGKVKRGWLGMTTQDLTQELATSFGLKAPVGALVSGIVQGSPSELAGVIPGDVIVEFNNKPVERSASVIQLLGVSKVNSHVPIKLLRNGKILHLSAFITELNSDLVTKLSLAESGDIIINELGIKVSDLSQDQREYMHIRKNGVLVKSIRKGVATKAGIHRADVIMQVGNKTIMNAQHLASVIKEIDKSDPVALLVQRPSGPVFLSVKLKNVGKK